MTQPPKSRMPYAKASRRIDKSAAGSPVLARLGENHEGVETVEQIPDKSTVVAVAFLAKALLSRRKDLRITRTRGSTSW